MAFRKETLASIGGFDPLFGPGALFNAEDVDAAGRASARGWAGQYCPEVVVRHHHGRKAADVPRLWKSYAIGRGAYHMKLFLKGGKFLWFARAVYGVRWRYKQSRGTILWEQAGAAKYAYVFLTRTFCSWFGKIFSPILAAIRSKKLTLYDDKFYEDHADISLGSARILLAHLWQYLQPASVLDVGCGRGTWLQACHELGSAVLLGMDGEWNNQSLMMDDLIQFKAINLNSPFSVEKKTDLAMSLEVAEHLESSSAPTFVDCLTKASDVVLFSAAYTAQGGTHHINEQPHSYWANLFLARGFVPFDLFRPVLWGDDRVSYWYRQNVFLYVKKASAAYQKMIAMGVSELSNIKFMDCIHPVVYGFKLHGDIGFMGHVKQLAPSFFHAIRKRFMG